MSNNTHLLVEINNITDCVRSAKNHAHRTTVDYNRTLDRAIGTWLCGRKITKTIIDRVVEAEQVMFEARDRFNNLNSERERLKRERKKFLADLSKKETAA